MNLIRIKELSKIYNTGTENVYALSGINLNIYENEFLAIMGRSASGKTTLLNIIGCLDVCTDGFYYLREQNIRQLNMLQLAKLRNKCFGFVLQQFALIDYFTVYENIVIPLNFNEQKLSRKKSKQR